jgi:putative transposase
MACRLIRVHPSGYYQFLRALPLPRKEGRLAIERAGAHPHKVASNLWLTKITRELPKLGLAAHRNTDSRAMRKCGIRNDFYAKIAARNSTTCVRASDVARFYRARLTTNETTPKWLCDITCILTDEGFIYLAGVMDAWSRVLIGRRSMSNTLHATVLTSALTLTVSAGRHRLA